MPKAREQTTLGVAQQGLKAREFVVAFFGPTEAVPLLQGLDRYAAIPVLL